MASDTKQAEVQIIQSRESVALQARTAQQWQAVRGMFCPPKMSDTEFSVFVGWCRHTGLDPTLGHAYCVERRSKDDAGNWSAKWSPMATEAGVTALVDAQADCRGFRGGIVYAGDEFALDEATSEVQHRWSPSKRDRTKLLFCWAHVRREGRQTPVSVLELGQRFQRNKDGQPIARWGIDPAGMLLKCARAEAARRAYPAILAGVYIQDEMPEEFGPAPAQAVTPEPQASRDRELLAKLAAAPGPRPRALQEGASVAPPQAAQERAPAPAPREPGQDDEPAQEPATATQAAPQGPPEPPPPTDADGWMSAPMPSPERAQPAASSDQGPTVFPPYGRAKGQPIKNATMRDLIYYGEGCRKTLDDPSKARWHAKEQALLYAIEEEITRQAKRDPAEGTR